MIKCQVCGYDNQDGAQFCLNCGSPLEQQKVSEAMDDISGEATVVIDPKALRLPPPKPAAPPAAAPPPTAPLPPPRAAAPPPAAPPPAAAPRPAAPPMQAAPQQPPAQYQPQQMAPPPPPAPNQYGAPMGGNMGSAPADLPNPWLYIGLSVASFLCCCLGGVISTVFSVQGMKAAEAGDYDTAMEKYKQARYAMIASVVIGGLGTIARVIMMFAGN